MTIVAQGSVLNKSDAGALLNRMENMLLVILAKNGENTILDMSNNQNSQTTHVPQSKSVGRGPPADESRKFKNSPFLWTKESQCIRTELASLSNVEEANIREDSSIFELGLDSIDVIKLSSRLKKQGIIISVSTIIKCQNISNMASNALIKEGGDPDTDASSGRYTKELGRDMSLYLAHQGKIPFDCMTVLPATPLQQTMVNEMLKSNFTRYFNLEAFVLDSGTDPRRLAEAVQSVASKSPILRTSFIELDDPRSPVAYAQVVLNDHACVTESKGSSLDSILTNFKAKSAAIAASSGLLFQVQIITAGKSNYMIWAISHALYDGASLRLLHLDVEQAYNRRFTARPDYRPFLDQIFKSSTEEGRSFWRNTLSNLPRAVFPRKDPSQVSDTATVHRLEKRSNVSLKDIEKLCKSSRVTPQTVGQTCWAILLAHLMGQLDVVFGTVLSCRDTEESNEIMFPLMNTVAVRSVLHGTLIDMLRYMQDMSDTTRQFQHFPLGTAQALALASHNGDHAIETTLFDTLFIYQGRRPVLHGTPLYESVFGVSDVEFPVCVEMEVINDHLSWTVACKPVAGNAIETEKIIEMLDATLERIIFTPEAPTIVSDADGGISICGWPKFRMSDMSTTRPSNSPLKSVDGKWSHTELVLRKAFHEVSGVSEHLIHKNTTIFQLGLDSIVILKIPALLRRDGIKLSVADILKDQTITCMTQSALHQDVNQKAAVVTDQFQLDALSLLDPSTFQSLEKEIGDIQSIVPVTPGQLYVIRMWQASWGILFYPSFTYSLNGSVDRIRLESAWVNLLRHHDILRTGFIETKAGTLQIIFRNPTHYSIHHVTAPQEKSEELFHGASKIDLRRPPLALAVEWSGSFATKVQLTIHHALYDGISLPILMEQLQFLYQGQNLPPAMSFKAFVAQSMSVQKQNSSKGPPGWKLAQDQWSSYLNRSSHQIQVATDTSFDDDDKRTEVFQPTRQVGPLRQLAQDIGISVDALLLATVSKVYAQLLFKDEHRTVTSDVVFGIYLANRAPFGEDLSALAAPTLNILPLRISNPTGREIASIAMEIQQDLRKISSSEMSCSSLEEIYEWTGVRVNFVVNILKNTVPDVETSNDIMFKPIQDMAQKAQVVGYSPNKSMPSVNGKSDAYLVSPRRDLF
jgi:ferricrocin synthase